MKTVYTTAEIPHLWAHGTAHDIRNGPKTLFTDGDTLYSYGYYFPIGQRILVRGAPVFLMNPGQYSVSTSRHQCEARYAVRNLGERVEIPPHLWRALVNPRAKGSGASIAKHYQTLADAAIRQSIAPRIQQHTRDRHRADAVRAIDQWVRVRGIFGLSVSISKVTLRDADTIRAEIEANRTRDDVAYAKQLADNLARSTARAIEAQTLVAPWRAGDNLHAPQWTPWTSARGRPAILRDIGYPILRINGEEIESSFGARVPVEDGRKALRILERIAGAGSSDESIGVYRGFRASPDGLRIGCHDIPWQEVRAFASHAGWSLPENLPAYAI